ncbi:MAG TPA: hypothetical protein VM818_04935 [Vicinamibacterales bacterium]|jgi:hypothetical protein|nr:hypothetical protein [Vicinamibacterales bacterium]
MRAFLIVMAIVTAVTSVALSQGKPSAAATIQGVWKTTSAITTGANPTTDTDIPASIVIYTRNHFSIVEMNNGRQQPAPAPPKDPAKLTDAEKLARYEDWLAVTANSGTYEIKGTTLIRRQLVAKGSPAAGQKTYEDAVRELRFEGNDKMFQTVKAADGKSVTTRTYVRLE